MRVLIAPDKFRGTLSAAEAARAIASGWSRVRPGDEVVQVPLADGGEGTMDALIAALGGDRRSAKVRGPLGDPVAAAYGLVGGSRGPLGVIEMAAASGLHLLADDRRDPMRASTVGTGDLILEAVGAGARDLLVCLGGSATTDGGTGMAQALGVRLLDARGRELGLGGGSLLELAGIDVTGLDPVVRSVRVQAACDVDSPLTGPHGAARTFAPQKGAVPEETIVLDRALSHLAAVVHRDLGVDVRSMPGAGAAGGLGAGLVAFLGARLRPGIEVVAEAVGLEEHVISADLVVTGEGAFDETSLRGKVASGVLAAARAVDVPALVLCGRADVRPRGVEVVSLAERVGEHRALREARLTLADVAAEVAEALSSRR